MSAQASDTVILIVEDELFVRMVAADALAEHGFTIIEADCAEEALEALDAHERVDLLFTDVNMPGEMDGIALAAVASARRPDVKLIVTSGARRLDAHEIPDHSIFISKPYDTRQLTNVIEAKLNAPR
jgi:CheY-like chemotaxis protein